MHEVGPFTSKVIYDNSGLPQGFMINDASQFAFVRNLQGDVIAVVDQNGETVMEYSYDPWGNIEYHLSETFGTEEDAMIFTALCPLTYRGYNYDFTTGLYYLQSRYYNPEWGRFINCDDTNILLATKGKSLGSNLFAYCDNNPVNKTDYDGKCPLDIPNKSVFVNIYGDNDHADMQIGPLVFGYGAYNWEGTWKEPFYALGDNVKSVGSSFGGIGGWTIGKIGSGISFIGTCLDAVEGEVDSLDGEIGVLRIAYDMDEYYKYDKTVKARERNGYSISVTDEEFIGLLIFYCSYMICFSDYSYWKWDPTLGKRGERVKADKNDYYWIDYDLVGCDYAIYRLFEKNCAILVKDAIETIMPERYEKAKPTFPIIMPSQLKDLVKNLRYRRLWR